MVGLRKERQVRNESHSLRLKWGPPGRSRLQWVIRNLDLVLCSLSGQFNVSLELRREVRAGGYWNGIS